jgi:sugar lactone lactonase YvrE
MKNSTWYKGLTTLAACAFLAPTLGSAKDPVQQGRSTFPDLITFDFGPEGVAIDKIGNVYVSVTVSSGSDQIWKFTPSGAKSVLADLGAPGYAGGLAVDAVGNVYMARLVVPGHGVYQVDPNGNAVLLPGTEQIVGADALAFDPRGTLYITEIFSGVFTGDPSTSVFEQGGIWRLPKRGTAELWLQDDLLTGLPPFLFPYPVGANGIGFYHGALYVINTDKALVVRIPVQSDGSPGQPEVWKQVEDVPESLLYGSPLPVMLDGLALDVHGNVYIAVPSRGAIIRINADDRSQETVAVYPEAALDAPLSLAFGTGKGERESIFVTNSGMSGRFVPGLPWPGPGLVKIEVGIPGMPLP